MFIEIGSRLKILDPSPELIKWCKENLEMTNPEYQQKARMHLWLGNTPRTLYLYEVNGNSLILPFRVSESNPAVSGRRYEEAVQRAEEG